MSNHQQVAHKNTTAHKTNYPGTTKNGLPIHGTNMEGRWGHLRFRTDYKVTENKNNIRANSQIDAGIFPVRKTRGLGHSSEVAIEIQPNSEQAREKYDRVKAWRGL